MGLTVTQKERLAAANAASKQPYPGWHDAVAGAVAGAGARILTHPLDLIRIRRQLAAYQQQQQQQQHTTPVRRPVRTLWNDVVHVIQNEGGIRGLFRGNLAAINLWVSYTAVQFYSYGFTKRYFQSVFPDESQRTMVAFCAGASAGVAATLSTYPLDLCRTIFAAQGATNTTVVVVVEQQATNPTTTTATNSAAATTSTANSRSNAAAAAAAAQPNKAQTHQFRPPSTTLEFATNLFQHRGWRGFFAGVSPTIIQIIPYMGCSFAIYDALTRGQRDVGLSAYAGSIAGAVSKALVYPMDTVKKRLQAQAFFASSAGTHYNDINDCITTIYRTEGPLAFYNGLVPSVLKTALAAGLSFAFFRSTKNLLESIHDDPFSPRDPPTRHSLQRRLSGH